jgi:exonuclease III
MKVVTWNCNGSLRSKKSAIDRIGADILIIQECEDPARSTSAYRDWAGTYLWHGQDKNRGIGVFLRSGETLTPLDWADDGLQLFLPCEINRRFLVLAVWTKHANSPTFQYIGQLWKYLQLHKSRLASQPFLICGDLNSNSRWDEWDRWWNHSDVVREIAELGGKSLYHEYFDEPHGKESQPTLYHQRHAEKPYHVDYAFATNDLFSGGHVEIGKRDEWIEFSDHMPMTFLLNSDSQRTHMP